MEQPLGIQFFDFVQAVWLNSTMNSLVFCLLNFIVLQKKQYTNIQIYQFLWGRVQPACYSVIRHTSCVFKSSLCWKIMAAQMLHPAMLRTSKVCPWFQENHLCLWRPRGPPRPYCALSSISTSTLLGLVADLCCVFVQKETIQDRHLLLPGTQW